MRTWHVAVLALGIAVGCNKGKRASTTPGGDKGLAKGAGIGSGVTDLRIPKVDETLCEVKDKKVEEFDLNHDGAADEWKLSRTVKGDKGEVLAIPTCKQVDLDHDGRKDWIIQYNDKGMMVLEDFDFDWDGRFDARVHYDDKGKKYLVERQTKHGATVDYWEKYDANEKLESVRRDRNGDGAPDYWEQYRDGVLEKILYDNDYDGKVDKHEEVPQKAVAKPTEPPAEGERPPAAGEGAKDKPVEKKPAEKKPAEKPGEKKPAEKKPDDTGPVEKLP